MARKLPFDDELGLFKPTGVAPADTPAAMPNASMPLARVLQDTPPVIDFARHGAGQTDPAVQYVTLMEQFYAHGTTEQDRQELKKAQAIIVSDNTSVIIGDVHLERGNEGKKRRKAAAEFKENLPTIEQWQAIIDALPGGTKWSDSLKKILGIDIYNQSYWGMDEADQSLKIVRMSGDTQNRQINPRLPHDGEETAFVRIIVKK